MELKVSSGTNYTNLVHLFPSPYVVQAPFKILFLKGPDIHIFTKKKKKEKKRKKGPESIIRFQLI